MALLTTNQAGRLAELIAQTKLSLPVGRGFRRALFRPVALGDKYPACDLIVDVIDINDESKGFFFVQVKGTQSFRPGSRLKVDIDQVRYNRLVATRAPAYVIGVDLITESAYIVAADRKSTAPVPSISTRYSLSDPTVKIDLYREVLAFWRVKGRVLQRSRLNDD